ncbi:hypothetical protein C8F04DRAFT_1185582 [Mycena alexandri]|uniref:Uncharacterized protein n=1 Tax=Mycena alexandri TaxID=1745969 RepID=A0AAD6SSS3_9AGAR|nr:hypothetical protein C8F04DRAFT_1185582 [Mycena alexandri]
MLDWLYITLIICLIASNLNRILSVLQWLFAYFSRAREPQLIPYFDEHDIVNACWIGELIGMVRVTTQHRRRPIAPISSGSRTHIPTEVEDNSDEERPVTLPRTRTHRSDYLLVGLPQIPSALSWDCWPDGKFQNFFSLQQLADTNNLAMNWVLETIHNRGSPNALTWQRGNEVRRRCLGVIKCHGKRCAMYLAPGPRAMDRQKQLHHTCPICEETLVLHRCGTESSLFRFREGGVFIHDGDHTHPQYTHSSIFHRNGSLDFLDYVPKYRPRSLSPSNIKAAARSLSPVESIIEEPEHDRASSILIHKNQDEELDDHSPYAGEDINDRSDPMVYDEDDEWEMRQDPEAELDELQEED